MINTSRPLDIFSFVLNDNHIFQHLNLKTGYNQVIRGKKLDNGSINPIFNVYHEDDFYKTSYTTVHNRDVRKIMEFLKKTLLDSGEYGDFGNEDMS